VADPTTAQRAPILVAGEPLTSWDSIATSDAAVLSISNVGGTAYGVGNAPGPFTITVQKNGNTGTYSGTVAEDPLVVTLGTPEPK
jgi:hypothetical protein